MSISVTRCKLSLAQFFVLELSELQKPIQPFETSLNLLSFAFLGERRKLFMDTYYFRQINLPFIKKCEVICGLMEFILAQRADIPRGREFDQRFLDESGSPSWLKDLKQVDRWSSEHVARLFWVCCELGFLRYQYPYPHSGQTYRLTRIGRWVARAPTWCATTYVAAAYSISIAAGPVQRFKKVRNMTAFAMAFLVWWLNHSVSTFVVAALATIAGIVGSWVASFVTGANDNNDLM